MFANAPRSRLLPMSLPFRYFGAAAAFQVMAWALLAWNSGEFLSFEGGLGPVFAALHLVTLGVLAMAAVGATLQLLPVATRQPVRSVRAAKLAWWLIAPGIALFAWGAATYAPRAMAGGAVATVAGFGIYAYLLLRNLLGARGLRAVVAHGWAALACLVGLAATGIALTARYEHGISLDHDAFRTAHLVLATYGFMGLLAFGLSTFLLPMLALAPPPGTRVTYAVLAMAVTALALGALGWRLPGALLGLAAAGMHVIAMERALRARLRAPLGPAFLLIRVSWMCLAASLVVAILIELQFAPPRAALLFVLFLVPGWLLTFLLGVLQRIVPFLASVHAAGGPRATPLVSALTPPGVLAAHRFLHLGALAALIAAALLEQPWLSAIGASMGLAGALAFGAFITFVIVKVHHGIQPPHQPAPA